MKDKKDTVEISDVKDEMIEETANETAEVEEVVAENAEPIYSQPAKTKAKKTVSWGDKGVTRKFLIASLVLTLLLNAALTAGMSALFGRHGHKDRLGFSDNNQNGRPNFEQFDEGWGNGGGRGYNGGGRMMPPGMPGNNSQNNNQNAAPDSNQNAAPNTNQDNTQNDAQTQGTSFEI